jgi:hypothetical protein
VDNYSKTRISGSAAASGSIRRAIYGMVGIGEVKRREWMDGWISRYNARLSESMMIDSNRFRAAYSNFTYFCMYMSVTLYAADCADDARWSMIYVVTLSLRKFSF